MQRWRLTGVHVFDPRLIKTSSSNISSAATGRVRGQFALLTPPRHATPSLLPNALWGRDPICCFRPGHNGLIGPYGAPLWGLPSQWSKDPFCHVNLQNSSLKRHILHTWKQRYCSGFYLLNLIGLFTQNIETSLHTNKIFLGWKILLLFLKAHFSEQLSKTLAADLPQRILILVLVLTNSEQLVYLL